VRPIDRLSKPQRIIVVIALGIAFDAVGTYVMNRGNPFANSGWYGFAPLTPGISEFSGGFYAVPTGLHGWVRLLIWLALIALWALASIRVLRPASEQPPHG
jgi:hypothetical protein